MTLQDMRLARWTTRAPTLDPSDIANLEASLIGGVLDAAYIGDASHFDLVADLPAEAFSLPEHRIIWTEVLEHQGNVSLPGLIARHPTYGDLLRDLANRGQAMSIRHEAEELRNIWHNRQARFRLERALDDLQAGRPEAEVLEALSEVERSRPPREAFRPITARALQSRVFAPVGWVVEGLLPVGLSILGGRPKMGKSWLALDIALAVARGGYVLSAEAPCIQGACLVLALEDTPRRLQARLRKLVPSGDWPTALSFVTEVASGNTVETCVDHWISKAENPRLVVVDTLAKVRPPARPNDYAADYAAIAGWKKLADRHDIAVVVVHHVRKGGADDPIEAVSGTFGITGAADSILVLNRDGQGASLSGRGRDLEEFDSAAVFDRETCRWSLTGNTAEARRSDERNRILEVLAGQSEPMSPQEVADVLGTPSTAIRQLLVRMCRAGEVHKAGRGAYSVTPPCHIGHKVTTAMGLRPGPGLDRDSVTVVTGPWGSHDA